MQWVVGNVCGRYAMQVWRKATSAADVDDDTYTLAGQTFMRLTELRFHEISLPASRRLPVSRGDLLGLYYPGSNPVGWSTVPCASARQRHRFVSRSSQEPLVVGDTLRFHVAPAGHDACRQYSFAALFGNSVPSTCDSELLCSISRKVRRRCRRRRREN